LLHLYGSVGERSYMSAMLAALLSRLYRGSRYICNITKDNITYLSFFQTVGLQTVSYCILGVACIIMNSHFGEVGSLKVLKTEFQTLFDYIGETKSVTKL